MKSLPTRPDAAAHYVMQEKDAPLEAPFALDTNALRPTLQGVHTLNTWRRKWRLHREGSVMVSRRNKVREGTHTTRIQAHEGRVKSTSAAIKKPLFQSGFPQSDFVRCRSKSYERGPLE